MINFLKEAFAILIIPICLISALTLWIFFPDYAWIPLTFLGFLIFIGWYQSEPGSGQFLAIIFLWMCASFGFFFLIGLLLEEQNFFYFYEDTEHGIKALGGAGLGAFVTWYAYNSVWNEARERYEDKKKNWNPKTEYWCEVTNRAYKDPTRVAKKKKSVSKNIAKKKVLKKKATKKKQKRK